MRTLAIAEHEWTDQQGYPTEQALKRLSQFSDEQEQALSLYFSLDHFSDKSHPEVASLINHWIEQIEGTTPSRAGSATGVLRELLSMKERILSNPRAFHIALFCPSSNIRFEASLPAPLHLQQVSIGYRYDLAPLVGAIERSISHLVVLIESDKARAFIVRGTFIQELIGELPGADLSINAEDSRVGWSHHIEGNVDARAREYWGRLSSEIAALATKLGSSYLIVGCRDALWGHMNAEFADLKDLPFHRFQLQRFEASPVEVLEDSSEAFEALRRLRYEAFEKGWTENPAQRTSGVESTLRALEQGAVRTLLLGASIIGDAVECGRCGRWQPQTADRCSDCQGMLHLVPVEGLLVRKALLSRAEILSAYRQASAHADVRAILRY